MPERWQRAIEVSADTLGEMLVQMANGEASYDHDELAAAALASGLKALVREGPSTARIEATARAIYDKLHDADAESWDELDTMQWTFWQEIATAALQASDQHMLAELEAVRGLS